ncbi:Mur ligase domain-containing protein [Kitasatospora sp. NPDC059795]|uniref:Mur ligase domain-containing protein n=1 Tax=Kitasatospora sp. NPDC059795 TaxID=3346949 RepID=UPI003648FE86
MDTTRPGAVSALLAAPHLVDVAAPGMEGLARWLAGAGADVTGSVPADLAGSPVVAALEAGGVRVHVGFDAAHVGAERSTVVWSGVVVGPHPELDRARVLGLPVLGRAVALNTIAARTGAVTVAVAGSHSTATAAAALAHVLDDGHTGWILNTPARVGAPGHAAAGHRIVIDLCPDNGTHEAAPPFAWQHLPAPHSPLAEPRYAAALIMSTGANAPHFEDPVAGLDAAERVARRADTVVLPIWDKSAALLRDRLTGRPGPNVVTVGLDTSSTVQVTHLTRTAAGFRIVLRHQGAGHSFDVPVAGRHHALAVCAAIATALVIDADPRAVVQRATAFPGAERCLATVGTEGGVTVVDSRARHPHEIAQDVLEAARLLTEGSLLVVLELDGLARAGAHAEEIGEALADADLALLLPVSTPLTRHTVPDPLDAIEQAALQHLDAGAVHRLRSGPGDADTVQQIDDMVTEGDLVLVVGTGQAEQLAPRLLAHLAPPTAPTPQS